MGEFFSIDVSDLHMFHGYEWWDLAERPTCDHACEHRARSVIGWGPTTATYELIECDHCGCRAWQDGRYTQERQRASGLHGFWWQQMDWRQPPHDARSKADG